MNAIIEAVFRRFSVVCFQKEGGFADDPLDPGGKTQMGVTWETYQLFAARHGWPVNLAAHKAMTTAQVELIQRAYFDGSGAPLLAPHSPGGGLFLADYGFHSGTGGAARALQRLLNDLGVLPKLVVDGVIGRLTLAAAERTIPDYVPGADWVAASEKYLTHHLNRGLNESEIADYLLTKIYDDRRRFLEAVYKTQGPAYERRFRLGFENRLRGVFAAAQELNQKLVK